MGQQASGQPHEAQRRSQSHRSGSEITFRKDPQKSPQGSASQGSSSSKSQIVGELSAFGLSFRPHIALIFSSPYSPVKTIASVSSSESLFFILESIRVSIGLLRCFHTIEMAR